MEVELLSSFPCLVTQSQVWLQYTHTHKHPHMLIHRIICTEAKKNRRPGTCKLHFTIISVQCAKTWSNQMWFHVIWRLIYQLSWILSFVYQPFGTFYCVFCESRNVLLNSRTAEKISQLFVPTQSWSIWWLPPPAHTES